MSSNPFASDKAVPTRLACFSANALAAVASDARQHIADGIMQAADAAEIAGRHGISCIADLMLLLLDYAKSYARPPISNFLVGAIGLESPSGNLLFGGNVEFPGTTLANTLHGEGFVATRAFNRGTRLSLIAIGEAHPCAHCRQYLSEFAGGADLILVDPLGHSLSLGQLYPWPFDPQYLGETGAVAGRITWPDLSASDQEIPPELLAAGRRSHAPYSRCPGAIVLEMSDGATVVGMAVESVAFNPSISPIQSALVDLLARDYQYDDIVSATLGCVLSGPVDYRRSTAEVLSVIAPAVSLRTISWIP